MAVGVVIAAIAATPTPQPSPTAGSGSSDLLSLLALIVSTISLGAATALGYLQFRVQARLTMIEEARRADEISLKNEEEQRAGSARITVQWQQAPPALILHNHGPAAAADVNAIISSAVLDHPPPGFLASAQLPLAALGVGESYALPITNPYGRAATITVELRWQDQGGLRQRTVSLAAAGETSALRDAHRP